MGDILGFKRLALSKHVDHVVEILLVALFDVVIQVDAREHVSMFEVAGLCESFDRVTKGKRSVVGLGGVLERLFAGLVLGHGEILVVLLVGHDGLLRGFLCG